MLKVDVPTHIHHIRSLFIQSFIQHTIHTHLPIYPPILALLWCHRNQPHIRYDDDDDNNNIHLAGGDWFKLNSFHPQFEMESISDPPVDKSALIYYYAYYSMLWLTDWLTTTLHHHCPRRWWMDIFWSWLIAIVRSLILFFWAAYSNVNTIPYQFVTNEIAFLLPMAWIINSIPGWTATGTHWTVLYPQPALLIREWVVVAAYCELNCIDTQQQWNEYRVRWPSTFPRTELDDRSWVQGTNTTCSE